MLFHISSSREPAFARSAAHKQNTRFCSASHMTGVRIQQGSECLAEFAFRNAFRHQLLKCLAPIRQHGFAMHLGGDRRTCACGYSAGQGGRLAFGPPCMEHMNRFGMAEMIS